MSDQNRPINILSVIADLQERCDFLEAQCRRLTEENTALREHLEGKDGDT